jgi:integrase
MPRPRKDGTPASPPRQRRLTELYVRRVRAEASAFNCWDDHQHGLVLRVQPTGQRAWKVVYRHHGRPRWYHIGDARAVGLADARRLAAEIMLEAARGKDPVAERRAERGAGTFAELAEKYVELYSKRRNKSWQQADGLVRRYLLPRWAKLPAKDISRADVRAAIARIAAPILANQVLAAASAIFSWGIKQDLLIVNPAAKVDRNPTQSRERVLSDSEISRFWRTFDSAGRVAGSALKCVLLTGQRPGEVIHMRREHIIDGWWEMPGAPDKYWPGTKNAQSHRVWLAPPVRAIIAELDGPHEDPSNGFVFAGHRGKPIAGLDAAMRTICSSLGVNEKVTPHDLRRTFSTRVTALGFGKDAMNRVTNHKEGGIASVYDRHQYSEENKHIMEAVAARFMAMVDGRAGDPNVVEFRR